MRVKLEFKDGTVHEYDVVSVTVDVDNVRVLAPFEGQVQFVSTTRKADDVSR